MNTTNKYRATARQRRTQAIVDAMASWPIDFVAMQPFQFDLRYDRRQLVGEVTGQQSAQLATVAAAKTALSSGTWKAALWEKEQVEPAMLRVPIVIITFIVLWGCNIWCLEKMRMQYYGALSIKSAPLSFSFIVSFLLAVAYAACMTFFSNLLGMTVQAGVTLFYAAIALVLILPGFPGQDTRKSFFRILYICFFPLNSITFPEVLLADALTSLSKVLKDIGVTMVAVYAQMVGSPLVSYHNEGMILVAMLASLPFAIRIRQCWVQLDGAADPWMKVPITLNLIKYATAFPPIWLAAAASLGYFHPDLPAITAVMATINSLYSYSWDICMDWGFFTFTRTGRVIPRQRMMLPLYCYIIAAMINLVLRFSWAANRIPQLSNLHSSHLVLMVELLEVGRRSMWNIIRIEWEVIVQADRASSNKDLPALEKIPSKEKEPSP